MNRLRWFFASVGPAISGVVGFITGTRRITENGNVRVTEDGNTRVMEG